MLPSLAHGTARDRADGDGLPRRAGHGAWRWPRRIRSSATSRFRCSRLVAPARHDDGRVSVALPHRGPREYIRCHLPWHNIPRRVQEGSSACARCGSGTHVIATCTSRVTGRSTTRPLADARHHLSVHVNGVFAKPVLVRNDRLRPGESTTLYFTFKAGQAGEHRLQVMIAEQHADPVSRAGAVMLETIIQCRRRESGTSLARAVDPAWALRTVAHRAADPDAALRRALYAAKLAYWRQDAAARMDTLVRYKELNRDLAFMEKQVRRERVASLPCYLAIDTTSTLQPRVQDVLSQLRRRRLQHHSRHAGRNWWIG